MIKVPPAMSEGADAKADDTPAKQSDSNREIVFISRFIKS